MNLKYLLFAVALAFTQCACALETKPQAEEFDQLCRLATTAVALDAGLDPTVYMRENLDSEVESHEVKDAYRMIFSVDPDERYTVFIAAASQALEKPWRCEPLHDLFERIRQQ